MKKFITAVCAGLVFSLPATVFANWNEPDKEEYMKIMFNQVMEYETYTEIMDTKETVNLLRCIGSFYEKNYSFDKFLNIYYEGTEEEVDEFRAVETYCIKVIEDQRPSGSFY